MTPPGVPPQARLWQLALGFAGTAVIHALVKTGVIERLRDRPGEVPELARACGLDADVLFRTLRFAAVIGVVTRREDGYALTDVGRLLLEGVPGSLRRGILLVGSKPWQHAWQQLTHALETGQDAFRAAMGADFFAYLEAHPEYGIPYHEWMTISTTLAAQAIVEAYDFAPFRTVADVGGGQGILLKHVLTAHPHLQGVLYDRESVVRTHVLGDLAARARVQAGDFFRSVPAADVLILKSVLHDWDDGKCRTILGHCRRAMSPSSRLLVVEMVIASPPDLVGVFYDLHMQVLLGGRERTEAEFRALLESAGLALRRVIPTRAPVSVLEAGLAG